MEKFLNEASFWMPDSLAPSAWTRHAPFAFWLMSVHRPKVVVELGTHFGFSYFVFAQAIKRLQIKGRCYAVDTWQGDEHAGYYGDEIFEQVKTYNIGHFNDFSELLRCTFDDALNEFEDGSIDLLHIDGRHFYNDVKHDFETWKPKLSSRAVVLFHDTNVRTRGFGVDLLWEQLTSEFPNFEFLDGHGLGVLGYGSELPQDLRDLFALADQQASTESVRKVYSRLGTAIEDRVALLSAPLPLPEPVTIKGSDVAETERLSAELAGINAANLELAARHEQLTRMYDELKAAHLQLDAMYLHLRKELLESDELLSTHKRQFAEKEQELKRLRVERSGLEKMAADLRLSEKVGRSALQENLKLRAQCERLETAQKEWEENRAFREQAIEPESLPAYPIVQATSQIQPEEIAVAPANYRSKSSLLQKSPKLLWWAATMQLPDRLAARRFKALIASSRLFDRDYYLAENPDVAASGADPITHYLERGASEGRNPHPLFDTCWYLNQNPDILAAGVNPLVHYLLQGWKEERAPHPLVAPRYYLRNGNSDIAQSVPVATHYAETGWRSGSNPHPLFDSNWYIRQNPDIATAELNPLAHYLQYGWKEGRTPHVLFDQDWCRAQIVGNTVSPLVRYVTGGWQTGMCPNELFDPQFYLAQNPDVAAVGVDPLEHYLEQGWREGRDPHPLFDNDWYLATYPDVSNSGFKPLIHYVSHGLEEGRNPNPMFDVPYYLDQTNGRESARRNPISDYLSRGASEGLDPHPGFDAAWYLAEYPAVTASGLNPLVHYLTVGRHLGLKPSASFSKTDRSERIRVVFVSGEPHTAGHKYRVLNLAGALPVKSYDTEVISALDAGQHRSALRRADIVWLWRMTWSDSTAELISSARKQGAKIIFDVDDLMFRPELAKVEIIDGIRTQSLSETMVEEFYARVQAVLVNADHCTVPTTALLNELRDFRKATTVIPNGFDRAVMDASKLALRKREREREDGLVRIGYAAGTRTHQRDLGVAARAIAKALGEFEFLRLVLYKGQIELEEFPELEARASQIEWRDLVPVGELPYEYARFDVNLAPLEVGNRFCEAKSELKYFEAALVEVPTIASPTAPFRNAIRHGETGYLANSEEEWLSALRELATNHAKRKQVALNARREILWLYGPERRALIMTQLLNQMLAPAKYKSQLFLQNTKGEERKHVPPVALPECEVVFEAGRRGLSRVSVVMPLFNYEQFLQEALSSVLDQTVEDLDLIIVDDVSSDDSVKVAESWLREHAYRFNFVALLRNRRNSKLGKTRNAAVDYSDTEFFLPLDPDNLLLPDCVAELQELLEQTDAAFAYPTIEIFGDRGGILGNAEFDPTAFQFGNYIDAMAMVRRACWTAVGGYAPLDPPGWEDYDFWCKLLERGFEGIGAKNILARYRVHGTSMLATTTEVPVNKVEVVRQLSARHPWLRLENELPRRIELNQDVRGGEADASGNYSETLQRLLPILQCPETGEELVLEDFTKLVTKSGSRSWPIVRGVPVFTPEAQAIVLQPETHVSNALPDKARQLIESSQGLVLNLSAGASPEKFSNVIELEYTIFKNTDVAGDVHRLPFRDNVFETVVCMNAFEHYRQPDSAMEELRRVLKPGGRGLIQTAFLQPLHEAPYHFFNCTEFGLRQWLRNLTVEEVKVSSNFNPIYSLSWLLSEMEFGFRKAGRQEAADLFSATRVGEILTFWRNTESRNSPIWHVFHQLPESIQRQFAGGWQAIATK